MMTPELWEEGCDIIVPFKAEHFVIMYCGHVNQLLVYVSITIYRKEKHI